MAAGYRQSVVIGRFEGFMVQFRSIWIAVTKCRTDPPRRGHIIASQNASLWFTASSADERSFSSATRWQNGSPRVDYRSDLLGWINAQIATWLVREVAATTRSTRHGSSRDHLAGSTVLTTGDARWHTRMLVSKLTIIFRAFVRLKRPRGDPRGFAHHFDGMIDGLLPFWCHYRRTIGREDGNGLSMFQNDDLLSPLDLGEQFGERLIGLTGADGLHDRRRCTTCTTL
jgi:hypothetical protein